MKKKFLLLLLAVFISLMMVSCILVTDQSYWGSISVRTMSSGHKVGDVYYVFAGKSLKDSIIVKGYYSTGTEVNVKEYATIMARKNGGSEMTVTDSLVVKAGEEYTVWAVYGGRASETITVKGVGAYELLEATSDRSGIYLKGATVDDMGTITTVYYDNDGVLTRGNMHQLSSDRYIVWQMKDKTTPINALTNTKNTLSSECRYLKVSTKNTDSSVLIPVTKIVDLSVDTGWEVYITGGFGTTIDALSNTWSGTISMYIKYDDVILKTLSSRTNDGSCAILSITRNSSDEITSACLRSGWKIEILDGVNDLVEKEFKNQGDDVKVNLSAGEYTLKVTCTNPENYGLPSGVEIVGKRDFEAR